jgi:PfaB family protein
MRHSNATNCRLPRRPDNPNQDRFEKGTDLFFPNFCQTMTINNQKRNKSVPFSIAIVGIGGVFPGATDPDQFWENIISAKDLAREPPPGRWSPGLDKVYNAAPATDKVYSRRACFVDEFTPDLNGLNIDTAFVNKLDPMFGLLLHAGRQAWNDTNTANLDRQRTGIIIGNIALPTESSSRLAEELLAEVFESQLFGKAGFLTRSTTSPINRYVAGLPAAILARALGLGGSSFTLDAACASSLYSIKYAIEELQSGRANAMLCGGLSRPDSLYTQMGFSSLGALSASGRCAPFDQKADGLVVGEGCGIVVLKRLDDALRDHDHIYATIAGTGLSNDIRGNLMLPDSEGQLRAMRAAYAQAGWQPHDIDLIECHGTGTPTGDKTEYQSMRTLWGEDYSGGHNCVIGSVKSNVGHLLTAAGSAGLIKVLMAIKHKQLPPTANFDHAASGIDMANSPFVVLNRPRDWQARADGLPRRAAVSAFGFGGINAHVLLQEWQPQQTVKKSSAQNKSKNKPFPISEKPEAVAIVGIDTHFGPWNGLQAFRQRVLGEDHDVNATAADNRWGIKTLSALPGYTIDKIEIPFGRFRIPPRELQEMLPQQLLMLQVAANALEDAGLSDLAEQERVDMGVFIGIALDLNTTNFHLRWSVEYKARHWAKQLGLDANDPAVQKWIAALRESISPALTANRTMGALGGIVASRIARAFNLGGPGFTISSEETSGLHALETAVRTLQRGELNIAIAGAVDLTGDVRAVAGQHACKPYAADGNSVPFDQITSGSIIGEGAVALVLKREEDAIRDGDRIYALITGASAATGGSADTLLPSIGSYKSSVMLACADAGIDPDSVSYIETHGSGNGSEDSLEAQALSELFVQEAVPIKLGSTSADIGHTGAAGGLASIAKTSLCLYHHITPPLRNSRVSQSILSSQQQISLPDSAQYWLRDRVDGPRRALVSSFGIGGTSAHVILEQAQASAMNDTAAVFPGLTSGCTDTLFSIEGNSRSELEAALHQLDALAVKYRQDGINRIAQQWFSVSGQNPDHKRAISLLAADPRQLAELTAQARQVLAGGREVITERLCFTDAPLGNIGQLAFVYPGSGNHFAGMGRDIACQWPQILERLDQENDQLAAQFAHGRFWQNNNQAELNHEQVIFGQVWLGTLISDVISSFAVKPDAIIGYSLGETAGLFATRTWTDRDLMLARIQQSSLFKTELAGPCNAARQAWGLSDYVQVDWCVGVINCAADKVSARISQLPWVYLLIINTPDECVIGGNRIAVESLIEELNCSFYAIDTITTVHCELAKPVQQAYRDLHLYPTNPPSGVRFYSGILGRAYEVTTDSAADSITGQAINAFDFTRVINSAYQDGVRLFIEMGPGNSCTRMIDRILQDRPHAARAVCVKGRNGVTSVLGTLALLNTHRVRLDLSSLYRVESRPVPLASAQKFITVQIGHKPLAVNLPPHKHEPPQQIVPVAKTEAWVTTAHVIQHPLMSSHAVTADPVIAQMLQTETARAHAHETFLRVANGLSETLSHALSLQQTILQGTTGGFTLHTVKNTNTGVTPTHPQAVAFDREMCLEFAIGTIGKVLGEKYADIDSYPTRVRLPDEPLMLVDRILTVEGEPGSMGSGKVVTEHDIHADAWYLDGNRIPTCIAVESGQADLFLSGYLGIDHITRGLAVYRLLDAEITFHAGLPAPGKTIRYDINIDHFFRQGDTHLFRFDFEGSVDGKPLLSMQKGCAGFFSQAELDAGKGIVLTELERRPLAGIRTEDWQELVPMQRESYNDEQLAALREGKLEQCFGPQFADLPFIRTVGLPAGRMTLVHRILDLDPAGGRYGLGRITGEADINPDDWFLTCHFIDDQVMPGTLMYECCLHTLRVYLLRLGWVGESTDIVYEPIPGVTSKLKCRGQVIASTSKVQYEISLKEIGYKKDGKPYVIADALMYADGRPIVQMSNMSVQLSGLQRDHLHALWQSRLGQQQEGDSTPTVLFDFDSILAFATGKPSEAFGDRYLPFDQDRLIARLPGPPYQFLDRIVSIKNCEQWQLKAGGVIEAEYDVPAAAWYFAAERQKTMPFSILLEIALQPCGWLAAYLGSALTSDTDLSFRNLGGSAVQLLPVTASTGTLNTQVKITNVALSGGMIIQNFDYVVRSNAGIVYKGDTYFGFFSKQALANQVGIRDVKPWQPPGFHAGAVKAIAYPTSAPYPGDQMRMLDMIELYQPDGGPHGLGYIRGTAQVNPDAWFFKAHFYQDPVWPGSLGLESFIQLLKFYAFERWHQSGANTTEFESMGVQQTHSWLYRGQIIPTDSTVTVEALIKEVDNMQQVLKADGFLSVDGRIIYQMTDFTLRMSQS